MPNNQLVRRRVPARIPSGGDYSDDDGFEMIGTRSGGDEKAMVPFRQRVGVTPASASTSRAVISYRQETAVTSTDGKSTIMELAPYSRETAVALATECTSKAPDRQERSVASIIQASSAVPSRSRGSTQQHVITASREPSTMRRGIVVSQQQTFTTTTTTTYTTTTTTTATTSQGQWESNGVGSPSGDAHDFDPIEIADDDDVKHDIKYEEQQDPLSGPAQNLEVEQDDFKIEYTWSPPARTVKDEISEDDGDIKPAFVHPRRPTRSSSTGTSAPRPNKGTQLIPRRARGQQRRRKIAPRAPEYMSERIVREQITILSSDDEDEGKGRRRRRVEPSSSSLPASGTIKGEGEGDIKPSITGRRR